MNDYYTATLEVKVAAIRRLYREKHITESEYINYTLRVIGAKND